MNASKSRGGLGSLGVVALAVAIVVVTVLAAQRSAPRAEIDRPVPSSAVVSASAERGFLRDADYAVTDASGRSWIP